MGPAPAVAVTRNAVRASLAEHPGPVLVACSGGADSLALAAATAFVAARLGTPAGLVTIDHGLQEGSGDQAARVVEQAVALGLTPVEAVRVVVGPRGGPEAAARDARYAALRDVAGRLGARVLLGHTRDDQAETVLLGLGRGSGPRSIAGMPRVDGPWLRPFLDVPREVTRAACDALGLAVWEDPHNADPRFTRVRLRRDVLPALDGALHGGVRDALARTAGLLRDDLDALDAWADEAYATAVRPRAADPPPADPSSGASSSGDQSMDPAGMRPDPYFDHARRGAAGVLGPALDVASLAGLPRAIRTRVLRRWAADVGAEPLSAERTSALDALVDHWHGQGPLQLPGGVSVRRASGRLEASPRSTPPGDVT